MRKKIKPSKLSEYLKEKIEEAIATGVFSPGMKLDEIDLANKFGVSRTPIREALIQLASSGLVEIRPRRGAVVTPIDPKKLYEMFEVMAELEALCAKLASRRITDEELINMKKIHEECKKTEIIENPDLYYYKNEEFHLALYKASHNDFLIEQTTNLHKRLSSFRRLQLRVRGRILSSLREHEEIINAITNGDADSASQLARHHIIIQGERFSDLLATLQPDR
ncbi:MAG: GntR family transcriptional regulator [Proteobacteria bacterium]|nr:GntR family transcriptional regulator [Pseudomonadota bacterium]